MTRGPRGKAIDMRKGRSTLTGMTWLPAITEVIGDIREGMDAFFAGAGWRRFEDEDATEERERRHDGADAEVQR